MSVIKYDYLIIKNKNYQLKIFFNNLNILNILKIRLCFIYYNNSSIKNIIYKYKYICINNNIIYYIYRL